MTDHNDRAHALLSASGAHRWLNCLPSAVLETQFPDTTSEAAEEGTLAHEIAEAKLRHYIDKNFSKRKLTMRLNKLKKDPLYQPEMDGYTDAYLGVIKHEGLRYKHTPHIMAEEKLDLSEYIPEGFGTADCVMIGGDTLTVIDLKYGKGVPVSAEFNEQLQIYALGVYARYGMLFGINTIRLVIVQPRIDNNSVWELPLDDLLAFGAGVKAVAQQAIKGEGDYVPGDWCRFCRARKQCRARAEENVKLAFATEKKPPLLTNDEVGEYIRQGEDVAKWLSDLEDYALAECLAGREVAGYKAVEGKSARAWTDMDKAFSKLQKQGIDEAVLYERKPLTLAQTEKLVGKKDFTAWVGEFVEKKPGKPTLVPETDKRPAITNIISAEEAFKED
jgi:hypothetical protein